MQDIGSFLERHQYKVCGRVPYTFQEFLSWAASDPNKKDVTISLTSGDVLSLKVGEDGICYQINDQQIKIVLYRNKPLRDAQLSAFFESNSFQAASFFTQLQQSILTLPFVDRVTPKEDVTCLANALERRKALYKLKIDVKKGAEINVTRAGLQALFATIRVKIDGLTEHYGSNTVTTKGKVYCKLNVSLASYTDMKKSYDPQWEMSIAIVYYVLPRTPTQYEVSQLKQCSTIVGKNKDGEDIYRINEWATIRSYKKTESCGEEIVTVLLHPPGTLVVKRNTRIITDRAFVVRHCAQKRSVHDLREVTWASCQSNYHGNYSFYKGKETVVQNFDGERYGITASSYDMLNY